MTAVKQVGILAISTFLPEQVRTNDWWPQSTVDKWEDRLRVRRDPAEQAPAFDDLPEGTRLAIAAMEEYRDDPFKGGVERRIIAADMVPSDMELKACREAIARAELKPSQIDLLLTHSAVPDYLTVPTASLLHKTLGLSEWCFSMGTEAACNSFQMQLALAEQMIKGGRAKYALLVQSSAASRFIRPEESHSAWFGDVASAVVVGPVSEGFGLLANAHRTDGSMYRAMVGSSRNGHWWDPDARLGLFFEDRKAGLKIALNAAEMGKLVVHRSLEQAGYRPDQVDFYASHQGTVWFRRVTQQHIGLTRARFIDSYRWTTSLSVSNLPFVMETGAKEGTLKRGDLVAMYSGGSGIVVAGTVLRWGV